MSSQNNIIKELLYIYLPDSVINLINTIRMSFHFYQNINHDCKSDCQKRILISYITEPLERDSATFTSHTNMRECLEIIKIFIELGYCIDIIHCLDLKNINKVINKSYDVIIGFGEPFYHASNNNQDAIKIIYLTESHPDFSLNAEKERSDYFYQRHNRLQKNLRSGKYYNKRYIDIADFGILIGNKYTASTYSFPQERLYCLCPTAIINEKFKLKIKDFEKNRKNFVWFGSYGAIHKGLDILIDAFESLPDYKLYVCGLSKKEKRLLKINENNIHDMGFINVQSQEFIDLVDSCCYVVLPSCSEGMATSVLTCMSHGLIPVVTRECGISLEDWGIYLDDYRVEYIRRIIEDCANRDPQILEEAHKEVYYYSRERFNISKFSYDLRRILGELLNKGEQ